MKLMHSFTRSRNPFRVVYFVLVFLLAGALTVVLALNTQNATASNLAVQTTLGTTITYQGHLNDGNNPVNGQYDFQFTLYDAETGGAAVGAPVTVSNVTVQQGVFTAKLDFGANAFTGAARWLEIKVGPAGSGNFSKLDPRQAISPAPYAIYADNASNVPWAGVTGKPAIGSITSVMAGAGLNGGGNSGDLTLGVDFNAVARSNHTHVGESWMANTGNGINIASNTAGGSGIFGENDAAKATPYPATNTCDCAVGVQGFSQADGGRGIDGEALATTGNGIGVAGFTKARDGNGVEGDASDNFGNAYGIAGYSVSPKGLGVYGNNSAIGGRGVQGNATAITGASFGVEGYSQSPQGLGIFGYNSAIGGIGIEGDAVANSGQSYGIYGYSQSPQGIGVFGYNATKASGGLAGYFDGPVTVTGKLTKPAGSFKIDHPLDPEHKYLYHSFVESPDMMNIYNGNVMLNPNGEAMVQMPAWFEALNMEFRYQLTPIGAPGPNLYIAQEISNNQFKIAGGTANMKVSWQVTGIRHDPYAQAHRIQVEEDKPVGEQGTYLYPTEYGQPVARGLNFQPTAAKAPSAANKAASAQSNPRQIQPDANK